jgi:DNA helicase MCM8
VGDPGLGKSQLLHACISVAPRGKRKIDLMSNMNHFRAVLMLFVYQGVYVCGTSSTQSGLTVTLHKDKDGELMLDAGALVMAHQGCCCIDEFDKMVTQQQVLLEAMEQQCVSIAKGGIMATIPARTCVIAAANPVGGHYNKAKTVAENLK